MTLGMMSSESAPHSLKKTGRECTRYEGGWSTKKVQIQKGDSKRKMSKQKPTHSLVAWCIKFTSATNSRLSSQTQVPRGRKQGRNVATVHFGTMGINLPSTNNERQNKSRASCGVSSPMALFSLISNCPYSIICSCTTCAFRDLLAVHSPVLIVSSEF
ncbi:uncharacterized protein EDB93DRAFT_702509 [Suillus bovinus]|uniref:uncharacterized protein n=1 Tax=Suillus bovinus TaxID=48563 RepID=UPI001B87FF01|nr:uncharacterized protein EDB93DRAFT_702509 [Suillus bovinus]KAG2139166.1 hypothetical protein EDB93DRAFT_702509 [Suillus bovinus]